jgi:transcriptional regulator with XRE-family HTH domain
VARGLWPRAELSEGGYVLYAQEFARRLEDAIGSTPIRVLARDATVSHSTVLAVLRGERWPDMVTIAKLEDALEVDLWPGPEIRARRRAR